MSLNIALILIEITKGGPGSGNWGHAGISGKRGGSQSTSKVMSITSGPTAKKRQAQAAKTGKGRLLSAKLENNKIEVVKDPNYVKGINVSVIVQVEDDGRAIAKSAGFREEVLAYETAKLLGPEYEEMIPPTVYRLNGGETDGFSNKLYPSTSVQHWVEDATIFARVKTKNREKVNVADMKRMYIFDEIIGNIDRHSGNFLITKDNRVKLIDNGSSFGASKSPGRELLLTSWRLVTGNKKANRISLTAADLSPVVKLRKNVQFKDIITSLYGNDEWSRTRERMDYVINERSIL